jgi:hypothetical protein
MPGIHVAGGPVYGLISPESSFGVLAAGLSGSHSKPLPRAVPWWFRDSRGIVAIGAIHSTRPAGVMEGEGGGAQERSPRPPDGLSDFPGLCVVTSQAERRRHFLSAWSANRNS